MFVARRVPGRNLHPTSYKSRQTCVMLVSVSHMRIFLLTEMRLQVELTFGRNGTVRAHKKLEIPRCSRERETGQERPRLYGAAGSQCISCARKTLLRCCEVLFIDASGYGSPCHLQQFLLLVLLWRPFQIWSQRPLKFWVFMRLNPSIDRKAHDVCVFVCTHARNRPESGAKKTVNWQRKPRKQEIQPDLSSEKNTTPKQLVQVSTHTHIPHIIHKSWTREGKIQLCHCFDPASNHANRTTWHKMLLWWCYSVGLTSPHKMNVNQKPNRRRNFAAESAIVVCLHKYTCVRAHTNTAAHAHTWSMTPA